MFTEQEAPGQYERFRTSDWQPFIAVAHRHRRSLSYRLKYRYESRLLGGTLQKIRRKKIGKNTIMKPVVLAALCAAMCFAGEPRKPACTARNQGQFWPAEANSNPTAARQAVQRGDLEICALGVWKYRWERLSVNARDGAKRPLPAKPRKDGVEEGQ